METPLGSSVQASERTPEIYIDLTKSDVALIDGLTVGGKVKVTITGKLVSISKREDDDQKSGTICVESKDISVKQLDSAMAELMDEDGD